MSRRILVLASGGGTNFQALVEAKRSGLLQGTLVGLLTDRPGTGAEDRARKAGIPHLSVSRKHLEEGLLRALATFQPDLLVLAGFLSILPPTVVKAYPRRILNLHPSLLPRHGGKGMYGDRVFQAVLAAGDTVTGATVHYVDEGVDTGPVLLSAALPVEPEDTVTSLGQRVHALEHDLLVQAVNLALTALESPRAVPGNSDDKEEE